MKKNLILIITLCIGTFVFSQNKNTKATLNVDGVCLMCKERIEKTAIRTKGVKSAVWSVDTHELKLIYDQRKTDLETVSKQIANAGHDTKLVTASEEAYETLAPCCRYRDKKVVNEHHHHEH